MSDEKELIRRALMGEKQAQEECTEKGIVLPCPFCGNENNIISNWGCLEFGAHIARQNQKIPLQREMH